MKKVLLGVLFSLFLIMPVSFIIVGCSCSGLGSKKIYFTVDKTTPEGVQLVMDYGGSATDKNGEYFDKNNEFTIWVYLDDGYEFVDEENDLKVYINGEEIKMTLENMFVYKSKTFIAGDFSKINVTSKLNPTKIERIVNVSYIESEQSSTDFLSNYEIVFNDKLAEIFGLTANQAYSINDVKQKISMGKQVSLVFGEKLEYTVRSNSETNVFAHAFSNPIEFEHCANNVQQIITDEGIKYSAEIYYNVYENESYNVIFNENSFYDRTEARIDLYIESNDVTIATSISKNGVCDIKINSENILLLEDAQNANNIITLQWNNYVDDYKEYYNAATIFIGDEKVDNNTNELGILTINLNPLKDYGDPFSLMIRVSNLIAPMVNDNKLSYCKINEYIENNIEGEDSDKVSEVTQYNTLSLDTLTGYNYYFTNRDIVLEIRFAVDGLVNTDNKIITITINKGLSDEEVINIGLNEQLDYFELTKGDDSVGDFGGWFTYNLTIKSEFLSQKNNVTIDLSVK